MFKRKALLIIAILFLAIPSFAEVTATMGRSNASGNYDVSTNSDDMVTFSGGVYAKMEKATTSDTLTAAESGKIFIVEPVAGAPATFILPTAALGSITESTLQYTFVKGTSSGTWTSGNQIFYVDPQSTDKIIFLNSGVPNTFANGDKIQSSGITGDSLTLIAGPDSTWYAVNVRGTWTDAN